MGKWTAAFLLALSTMTIDLEAAPIKILPVGDSLTIGMASGPSSPAILGGYRSLLIAKLREAGYDAMLVGHSLQNSSPDGEEGKVSSGYHSAFPSLLLDEVRRALGQRWSVPLGDDGQPIDTKELDYILVMLGTTDLLRGVDPKVLVDRYSRLLRGLRLRYPLATIGVATIPPIMQIKKRQLGASNIVRGYNGRLRRLVAKDLSGRIELVEIHPSLEGLEDFVNGDGVHPTRIEGFQKMADVWFKFIETQEKNRQRAALILNRPG